MVSPLVPPHFMLKPLRAVSPSLNEILRNCPLQAALSRIAGIRDYVIGNPKAWLGTAYHHVLEKLWLPNEGELNEDELVERLWSEAIESLARQAAMHPLNRRFASSELWPGYYLARAFVGIRAQEALSKIKQRPVRTGEGRRGAGALIEKKLTAMNGKLVGKPDMVIGDEICDYKSGSIFEDTDEGVNIVKEGYIRQLQLYAHLVHETTGHCPAKGKLLPMQGDVVEVSLNPDECAREATAAVQRLEALNSRMHTASRVSELATPSPSACRWCQFKVFCPAFWETVENSWAEGLGRAAVRGTLTDDPRRIHDGSAYAITVAVTAGTVADRTITIAPLNNNAHPVLAGLHAGDQLQVVNLYQRRDGQLAPTSSTVCMPTATCPIFELPGLKSTSTDPT